mgnify:FL=1
MKFGFIGTGVITGAIVTGLLKQEGAAHEFLLSERSSTVSSRLAAASAQVRVTADNQEIADQADILFLAVLPQAAEEVLQPLTFRKGQKVVSLIATVTHERLRGWIGEDVQITRAIPLPAVAERRGVTVLYPEDAALSGLFSGLGRAVTAKTVEEFDAYAAASALMGTYFGVLETAAGWLAAQGCPEEGAQAYLTGVFSGLAQSAEADTGSSFSVLRESHSTPGGLNEQMFQVFDSAGGSKALAGGLDSIIARLQAAKEPGGR